MNLTVSELEQKDHIEQTDNSKKIKNESVDQQPILAAENSSVKPGNLPTLKQSSELHNKQQYQQQQSQEQSFPIAQEDQSNNDRTSNDISKPQDSVSDMNNSIPGEPVDIEWEQEIDMLKGELGLH